MGKLNNEELEQLLTSPEIGVLCTVDGDGAPEGSPIWYIYEDGKILVHVGGNSKKARNVRANPQVSLTVDTRTPPYRGAVLHGKASIGDADSELRKRLAYHYLGEQMGDAYLAATTAEEASSVLIEFSVASRYTWDYSKDFGG